MKVFKFLSLFAFVNIFLSCATPTPPSQIPETKQPINMAPRDFPQFGVAKMRSNMVPGTVVGAHYDGLLKVKQRNHYATGAIRQQWQDRYRRIILEELSKCGCKVPDESSLFETDESYACRFLIGGTITNGTRQTFGPLAGNYTECSIEIEWEVFDKEIRKVVYKAASRGYAKQGGVTAEGSLSAFRNSFRNFLADQRLVAAIERSISGSEALTERPSVAYYANNPTLDKSPNRIDMIRKAVFAIKTEGGHGSGFVINPQGYAVTNYHVVAGRSLFDAIFPDGKTIRANVVKTIPGKDLALIKLTGKEYPYLPLGKSDEAIVGKEVYAIGSPLSLGLSHSVSKGIISGIRRIKLVTLVQTDASVNPGNSGGPLTDSNGLVLGVITMKVSQFGVEGIGFAISSNDIVMAFGLQSVKVREK